MKIIRKYLKEIDKKSPKEKLKIGRILVIIGIVGIILPLIPGIILIFAGFKLIIKSKESSKE